MKKRMLREEYNDLYKVKTQILDNYRTFEINEVIDLDKLGSRSILVVSKGSEGSNAPTWYTYRTLNFMGFRDGDRGKIFFKGVMPTNLYFNIRDDQDQNVRCSIYPSSIFSAISTNAELAKRDILCVEYHVITSLNTIFFFNSSDFKTYGLGHL